jgi:hypothetical protein
VERLIRRDCASADAVHATLMSIAVSFVLMFGAWLYVKTQPLG